DGDGLNTGASTHFKEEVSLDGTRGSASRGGVDQISCTHVTQRKIDYRLSFSSRQTEERRLEHFRLAKERSGCAACDGNDFDLQCMVETCDREEDATKTKLQNRSTFDAKWTTSFERGLSSCSRRW
ncbi:hypothetical protein Csa_023746, partial [Cucumis sativus]